MTQQQAAEEIQAIIDTSKTQREAFDRIKAHGYVKNDAAIWGEIKRCWK